MLAFLSMRFCQSLFAIVCVGDNILLITQVITCQKCLTLTSFNFIPFKNYLAGMIRYLSLWEHLLEVGNLPTAFKDSIPFVVGFSVAKSSRVRDIHGRI